MTYNVFGGTLNPAQSNSKMTVAIKTHSFKFWVTGSFLIFGTVDARRFKFGGTLLTVSNNR